MVIRGLELSTEKTLITSMEDGFDFLGFNHRHYNGKLLIKPSKKDVLKFWKGIGKIIKNMNGCEQDVVIKKLNSILRGFANYYRGQVSKETFSYISIEYGNTSGVGLNGDIPKSQKDG